MQDKKIDKKHIASKEEPVFIIKPAIKNYGLDYLHISLIILVLILIMLSFSLAITKPTKILQNCPYGISNGSCSKLPNTYQQVMQAVGHILAGYSSVNTSLSLLPYFALFNETKAYYLVNGSKWLVIVPFKDPYISNAIYNFSMVLNSNLSVNQSYLQTIKPAYYSNDSVVGNGVISIYGKTLCNTTKPIPVYLIDDPYAPGSIKAINLLVKDSSTYGNAINTSYFFVFGSYAQNLYNEYGVGYTQNLGYYLFCASKQGMISQFASNLSTVFNGYPLSNSSLSEIAESAKLNMSSLAQCLGSSYDALSHQATLANFYNVVSTPTFIVNCKYEAIPQTLNNTIKYALNEVNKSA
ncbi:MAG: DsbA family protein [Candidatus Micrarchaeia archaeon]